MHPPPASQHETDYQRLTLPYRPHNPQDAGRVPFVVVGAGPVGLSMALDLARHGHDVVVLDDDDRLSLGSRAICFSKRSLDIWDRLGVGQRMVDKGVSWNVGKVFFRDDEVWRFDLLPEPDHRRPAFINLQQYYCEGYLMDAACEHPGIDLRWRHKAVDIAQESDLARLTVQTPDGDYTLEADWVVACDGSRSALRRLLGLETRRRVFHDRFLIADVRMTARFPSERWFWFDPPFHRNQSVLLHRQPDNVWRIDFQLGRDADPVAEAQPEQVIPRIRALLGHDVDFDLEWVSVYTFCCERMARFRHGRVVFAGDSAYRVSPFGARGANSGLQDADNLGWKLSLVARGHAPGSLIDTYDDERGLAADENLLNSSRSTDFITPKSPISLLFRNVTLALAKAHPFARGLVNSGRLSVPTHYPASRLTTPDEDPFDPRLPLGAAAPDGPVRAVHATPDRPQPLQTPPAGTPAWWLSHVGTRFVIALFCPAAAPAPDALDTLRALQADHPDLLIPIVVLGAQCGGDAPTGITTVVDIQGCLAQRYDVRDGACYLFRPDQHIAARWRTPRPERIRAALRRAMAVSDTRKEEAHA